MVAIQENGNQEKSLSGKSFVFINKSTNSTEISRVEGKEQRLINRHVQRYSHAQRRSKQLVKHAPLRWTHKDLAPKPFLGKEVTVTPDRDQESDSENDWDMRTLVSHQQYQPVPGSICRPGSAMDPFTTTDTSTKPWAYAVIDYFVNFWSLAAFKAEVQAAGSEKSLHREAIQELTRSALHNPMHLYAIASAVASRLHFVSGDDRALSRYGASPRPEWFLGNALRTLRENFGTIKEGAKVDPATVIGIYCIYNAEFFARNYDAARIHLKIFDLLARRAGGFDSLNFFCRELWALGDVWMAIETLSSPVFIVRNTPLSPVRTEEIYRELDPSERSIGTGFGNNGHIFSPDMANLMGDLIEWAQIAQYVWSRSPAIPEEARWLSKRASHLVSQLLRMPAPPSPSLEDEEERQVSLLNHKQECVRITLVICLSFILTYLAAKRSGKLNCERLKTALLNTLSHALLEFDEIWHPNEDMFVWVMFIGIYVAEQTGFDESWFTSKFFRIAHLHGIETGTQLSQLLRRYLYFDSLHAETLQRISNLLDDALFTPESIGCPIWYGLIE